MKLYFLRHGVAADAGPTGDAERPLTPEGVERMRREARGMRRLDIRLDVLLTSPLVRARQTAEITGRELGAKARQADVLAPGCDIAQLIDLLGAERVAERVMVVGHEPDFSTMICELTGARVEIKKGGLARVDLEALTAGAGVLVWLLPPSALRAIGD